MLTLSKIYAVKTKRPLYKLRVESYELRIVTDYNKLTDSNYHS